MLQFLIYVYFFKYQWNNITYVITRMSTETDAVKYNIISYRFKTTITDYYQQLLSI